MDLFNCYDDYCGGYFDFHGVVCDDCLHDDACDYDVFYRDDDNAHHIYVFYHDETPNHN